MAKDHASADAFRTWLTQHHKALASASVWSSPTEIERRAWSQALGVLLRDGAGCVADERAAVGPLLLEAGYGVEVHAWPTGSAAVFTEVTPHGGGLLVLRCGSESSLIVQAPHSRYDLGTGDIAMSAVALGDVRGGMWNTVHRYRAVPGEQPADRVHVGDVAHQATSLFHTATLAWAWADPTARFVQLHGFDARRSEATAVLSSGREDRPPTPVRAPLATVLGVPESAVLVFGLDQDDLGGTTNVQARALGAAPVPRFLHVELSRTTRETLEQAPERVVAVVRALDGVPWAP